jgi:hypothetical protein
MLAGINVFNMHTGKNIGLQNGVFYDKIPKIYIYVLFAKYVN